MATLDDPRAAFAAAIDRPEPEIDLGYVALTIAAEEYRDLDVDAYVRRLDELADGVRPRLSGDEGPSAVLSAINGHLFRALGFRGNRDDYYDPRNSFLNDVLDRRTGIPITLSIVYREVARRLGFELVGINFPLHFVLAWPLADGPLIVDPFDDGAVLTRQDCEDRLRAAVGGPLPNDPIAFEPVGARPIVRRVLNNLRMIYIQREDYRRALAAIERMAIALPAVEDVRDRGLVLFRLARYREAEAELVRYLELVPTGADHQAVAKHLDWVRQMRARSN